MRRHSRLFLWGLLAVVASPAPFSAQTRSRSHTHTYYIAADTITWNYTPSGTNQISDQPFDSVERRFVEPAASTIGHVALKAIYREYTDSTFGTLKPRPPAWEHLGILGPLLRAEVGDTIRVVDWQRGAAGRDPHLHLAGAGARRPGVG